MVKLRRLWLALLKQAVLPAAALRGALEAKHPELVEASSRYFRDLFAVYSAVATPDGSLCMSGARAKGTIFPCTEVGSMIYRTVHGLPQQGVAPREELWSQSYYAAARAVRRLVRRGDDLGGAAKMRPEDLADVKLAYPMRVERYADRVGRSSRPTPAPSTCATSSRASPRSASRRAGATSASSTGAASSPSSRAGPRRRRRPAARLSSRSPRGPDPAVLFQQREARPSSWLDLGPFRDRGR